MDTMKVILNACRELDSISDETSILNETLEAACLVPGVDCACIYEPESASGQFVIRAGKNMPDSFLESFSRLSVSPADSLPGDDREVSEIAPLGAFRLIPDGHPGMFLFTAAIREGIHPPPAPYLQWLACAAGTSIRRVRAMDQSRRSLRNSRILLDRVKDPLVSIDRSEDVLYCNGAFRDLVHLGEQDGGILKLREAAGKDLYGIISESLKEALASEVSTSLVCDYRDRMFNTGIQPVPDGLVIVMRDVTDEEAARRKLRFREKFESLLVSIAIDFIEMQGTALNMGIHDALLSIGVAIGVDRAYLFQFSDDGETMSNTHEWCASNIQPLIEMFQSIRISDYPWWMNKLNLHETVHVESVSQLPRWAEAERELMRERDVQSLVAVPIVHGNDLIGCLGFDSVNRSRRWSADMMDLLRMVGDTIGNALERNRMEKTMMRMYRKAEKEAQLNAVLLREVNHRVKNNLSEIIGLLYAQKRFSTGDYSDFIQNLTGRIRGLATVHDLLSRSGWKPLELTRLAKGIVNNAIAGVPEKKRLRASVSNSSITVNANQAHALALILNELVRNSIKHALGESDSLLIKVRMRKDRSGRVNLTYSDDGKGYPEGVISLERKNLGLDLIQNLVVKNLQGSLTLFNDGGASARIGFRILPPGEEADEEE